MSRSSSYHCNESSGPKRSINITSLSHRLLSTVSALLRLDLRILPPLDKASCWRRAYPVFRPDGGGHNLVEATAEADDHQRT